MGAKCLSIYCVRKEGDKEVMKDIKLELSAMTKLQAIDQLYQKNKNIIDSILLKGGAESISGEQDV